MKIGTIRNLLIYAYRRRGRQDRSIEVWHGSRTRNTGAVETAKWYLQAYGGSAVAVRTVEISIGDVCDILSKMGKISIVIRTGV